MPATPEFGRVVTAMITPFDNQGALDIPGAQRLAEHLVELGSDGLVINGTTGEAPTTSDIEKENLLRAVIEAVGDRATITAGVGTNDTAHTVELAQTAQRAGAHNLLIVTPYYNKPPQAGLIHHFHTVAQATELPIMLYDIPGRTGVALEVETLVTLAEHPRIRAVKDAKGDIGAASWTMARTPLQFYSGDDMNNLALLAVGAVGFVSVVAHLVADRLAALLTAYQAGEVDKARAIHRELLPIYTGFFRTQGVITTKAALAAYGLPSGPVRSPLVNATSAQLTILLDDLAAGGLPRPVLTTGDYA